MRSLSEEVTLVTASDDGYAMPLAVMVRSALDTLGSDRRLRLFVLDGGISPRSRARMVASWGDPRLTVDWVQPDLARVADLPVSDHVNVVAYLRLLMPSMLPEVGRALYLDPDMIVRRDLGRLWDTPQGDFAVLATADIGCPYLDCPTYLPTFARCKHRLAAWEPVANFRQLGLRGDARYFNSGVIVVDLDRWRREGLADQMLAVLRDHREHVLWWDQYAMNVVLSGRWGELDPRWNQGANAYFFPRWNESPLERGELKLLRDDPWVVHFNSPDKPWNYFCAHPWTGAFRAALQRTEWRDWRPTPPADRWEAWKKARYKPLKNRVEAELRAWRDATPFRRRAA